MAGLLPGAEGVPAALHAGRQDLAAVRSEPVHRHRGETTHVDAAQHGDPVAVPPLEVDHGFHAVLEGVLGVDADVIDQLLHDRRVVAARVQAEGHPVGMAELGDAPHPGEHVPPVHLGRHEGTPAVREVVAHDAGEDHPEIDAPEGVLDDAVDDRAHALEDVGGELRIVVQHERQGHHAHEPAHVLEHARGPDHELHAVGQVPRVLREPLAAPVAHRRPRVPVEVAPAHDDPVVAVQPLAPARGVVHARVVGLEAVGLVQARLGREVAVVVAEPVVQADLRGGREPLAGHALDHRVLDEQLVEGYPVGNPAARQHLLEASVIGPVAGRQQVGDGHARFLALGVPQCGGGPQARPRDPAKGPAGRRVARTCPRGEERPVGHSSNRRLTFPP